MQPELDFNILSAFVIDDDSFLRGDAFQVGVALRDRKALAHALLMHLRPPRVEALHDEGARVGRWREEHRDGVDKLLWVHKVVRYVAR